MATQQINIDIPETVLGALHTDTELFSREIRLLAAIKLFELRRLSSARAAELAGVSRIEFLLALGQYKVFPFQAELEELERRHD